MMRLVIEEMAEREAERERDVARVEEGPVDQGSGKPLGRERRSIGIDRLIGLRALAPQVGEIGTDLVRQRGKARRLAGEAPEPETVAEEDVVERAVQRFEESAE